MSNNQDSRIVRESATALSNAPERKQATPLAPAAAAARLQTIAADLQRHHNEFRRRFQPRSSSAQGGFQPERIALRYPHRYGDGLTGHPVARDEAGRAPQVVECTNNVIEQFFGSAKQGPRRRVDRADLGCDWRTSQPRPP